MIVPLQREHAARVAELHCAALAGDFLPSLGQGFLTVFYKATLDLGVGFGFVAIEAGCPVGFILGSADTSALFKRVVASRAMMLALRAIPSVIHKPALIANVFETFLYPGKEDAVPEKAELVVIGFDAAHRGRGLGRGLVNALNAAFRAQGVQSYKVTVLQSNQGANSFYRALGFQPTLEFELYKKKWNLYTIDVTRDA
jgi:ribosomal protein S18 acetylase RimI-like enzyme